jgi:protease IV
MKNFFTAFFASLSAMLVFAVGGITVAFLLILALAALGEKKPVTVPTGAYLVFDLSATIHDTPSQADGLEDMLDALGGGAPRVLQLREVTRALEAASRDETIKGLYLTGHVQADGYGSGFAALHEVREAIAAFKAAGKPVKAYLNYAGTRDYYLVSAASEIVLDPYGAILMPGLASQPMFLRGALDKLGVGVQVTRVGKYKSAVEPYTRTDLSPESRAQTQKLLDDVWSDLVGTVEQARSLPAGSFQKLIDEKGLLRAEAALAAKLVDRVAYRDEVLAELKTATDRADSTKPFKQIALKEYAKLVPANGLVAKRTVPGKLEVSSTPSGKIAVVYAEGEIVDGHGHEEGYVFGDTASRILRRLREDDSVKAVVLRVNSPGGSVSASEAIQREVRLIQEKKPVVVSMGSLAASGGYWISTNTERVFAEPTTITGSIGVFGLFMNFQGLANDKLGLTFDTVKTGQFADLLTATRPKSDAELALFQGSVDWVYDQFLDKVAGSRKLDRAVVAEIAQGRVWSGREALKLGLVDELGGLAAAVKFAAVQAKLGESPRIAEYPQKKPLAEALKDAIEGRRREQAFGGPVGALLREATAEARALLKFNDPQGLYARLPFDLKLN